MPVCPPLAATLPGFHLLLCQNIGAQYPGAGGENGQAIAVIAGGKGTGHIPEGIILPNPVDSDPFTGDGVPLLIHERAVEHQSGGRGGGNHGVSHKIEQIGVLVAE